MKLEIFKFKENEVRTQVVNGEPYFVGKDVAEILDYKEPNKSIVRHVDEDDRMKHPITDNIGRTQEMYIINESGLYSLILKSKLPQAKEFKRWVTSEVLPNIRKHGAYMTEQTLENALTNPDFLISLATQLKEEQNKRKELETTIKQQEPKVIFADAVSASKSSILVGALAKLLRQNGINIGQNRLFTYLREHKYLMKRGEDKNLPTQSAIDRGLFEIKKTTISNADGSSRVTRTPKVTGKGQVYFINKFLNEYRG